MPLSIAAEASLAAGGAEASAASGGARRRTGRWIEVVERDRPLENRSNCSGDHRGVREGYRLNPGQVAADGVSGWNDSPHNTDLVVVRG
jgi:hypothetical protein